MLIGLVGHHFGLSRVATVLVLPHCKNTENMFVVVIHMNIYIFCSLVLCLSIFHGRSVDAMCTII